jgi:transaldolase
VKLFLDSACLSDVSAALCRGLIRGVTTNPTLVRQEAQDRPLAHLRRLVAMLRPFDLPLAVQVMSRQPGEMLRQAELLRRALDYDRLAVKVPCGWAELEVVAALARRGAAVNCTAAVTAMQAISAADAGARYVTLFCGKMSDLGIDPWREVAQVARSLRETEVECELMVASLRKPFDVHESLRHGAHVATVPLRFLESLANHPKTDETVQQFARDFMPFEPPDSDPETDPAPA